MKKVAIKLCVTPIRRGYVIMCDHLFGEDHTDAHKIFCGVLVIILGVYISKVGHGEHTVVQVICDGGGYLIHGLGSFPIIDLIMKSKKQ